MMNKMLFIIIIILSHIVTECESLSNCLTMNQRLTPGEYLVSANGLYVLLYSTAGRACIYSSTILQGTGTSMWCFSVPVRDIIFFKLMVIWSLIRVYYNNWWHIKIEMRLVSKHQNKHIPKNHLNKQPLWWIW